MYWSRENFLSSLLFSLPKHTRNIITWQILTIWNVRVGGWGEVKICETLPSSGYVSICCICSKNMHCIELFASLCCPGLQYDGVVFLLSTKCSDARFCSINAFTSSSSLAGDFIVKLKEMPASRTVLGSPLRPGGVVSRAIAVSHASEWKWRIVSFRFKYI